ncbi:MULTISPECIES: inositol 2-dehydrogenase [unclassified Novosphingobium]|uniref:inositol 2-dehydrogenase n=1 Tax=unclassified Novosphingobium TaxID=2644732 RepID=UPI000D2F85B1|nr:MULTISPECIES: inositol 2-dehydrogenase [unclassified Novosphingobium]PTR13123.1 myo-inositol 2-dehydrogenase [Novosphingobium sp. GV055]PUB07342.1 myo-inositol 2-dehydrogenase [Novosphingobium sp. GV061]PUB23155.1 myo-inositol 2-dehydrogenase [Novosphingobium sp. GV079]PUB44919.1 myo-inositol 2-dehydrogenase [Novosphingobium sp. GV027]
MHTIALLGAGRIGAVHAAHIARHPGLRLAVVADIDPAAGQALADRHGALALAPEQALDHPGLAGVVIASPTALHAPQTLDAAARGLAVLCEKPLALDLAVAQAALARLDALGARVLMGFNRRHDPDFAALHAALVQGSIGGIETLHIISHDPAPPPPAYVATSGGIFHDMVIHDFDMARWLLGEEPVEVMAATACLIDPAIGAAGDADTAKTILRTASGRMAMISSSRRSGYGYDQRIEAFGARGALRVGNVPNSRVEHWGPAGAAAAPFMDFFLDRYAAAFAAQIAHFAQVIDGAAPLISAADGLRALLLAQGAQESARSGAFVRV